MICIPVLAFPKASKIGLAETILHKRVGVKVRVSRRDRVRMPFVQLLQQVGLGWIGNKLNNLQQ